MKSLVTYLDERLGSHRGNGPEFTWHCPACIDRIGSESSTPKLHVNTVRAKGHCFRCDYGFHDFEQLFRYLNNGKLKLSELRMIRKDAQLLADGPTASVMAALKLDEKKQKKRKLRAVELPKMVPLFKKPVVMRARKGLNYLHSRGVSDEQIAHHGIHYCSRDDNYGGYLVFPVLQGDELIYFTTRYAGLIKGRALKSKNPPKSDGFHAKSTVLLNYDDCVGEEVVALVEGPFDVMAWGNAIGLLGKDISDQQVALIEQLVAHGLEEIVISLDDEAGKQAINIWRRLTGRVPNVSILFLEHGDPWDRRDSLARLSRERRQPTSIDLVVNRATIPRTRKRRGAR